MDYALIKDGSLAVIEVGDGQVSGLPGIADKRSFYAWLYQSVYMKDGTIGTVVYVFPCSPPMYMLDLANGNGTIEISHDHIEKVIK